MSAQSWQGLAVGLAIAIAMMLLLVAVAVVTSRSDGDDATPTTEPRASTTVDGQAVPSVTGGPTGSAGPPTTRKATPVPIIASDDRRVVVLDQTGAAAPRTLFDLGPSTSSDEAPPGIGGVSLSGDGKSAYFDVVGTPAAGALKRVPVAGGPAEDVGDGVAPVPSPDGALLALIQAPEPDAPATLVLRPLGGGSERRLDLGDGTCGNITWAPSQREVAVDICSGSEPTTVALVDLASAGVRSLTPPDGVTWSVPSFKPDGTLTLVEQRETDAAVVTLKPDRSGVATTLISRPSTTINTIDWSAAGDLLVCDADAILLTAVGGAKPEQVATGFSAANW
jgi:hypothetical protein